jgi:hypothetical protein
VRFAEANKHRMFRLRSPTLEKTPGNPPSLNMLLFG